MKKTGIIAIVAGALIVAGGGTAMAVNGASAPAPVVSTQTPEAASTSTPGTSSMSSSTPAVDVTAAGEVCDPHNLNDTICAAFYPDQAVLNMTSAPRAGEPLASLSESERIALAHKACDQLADGMNQRAVNVIDTAPADAKLGKDNSFTLASAGAIAYCPQYLPQDAFGKSISWTLDKYRSMGEQAAKESFKDGVVIKP